MIEVRNLSYRYEGRQGDALRGVDLTIPEGAYFIVVGPNGCGKTTLIRHLNGLLRPVQGEVLVDGMDTRDSDKAGMIRQRVGMVFGNPDDQIFGMTVEEDVAFGPGNLNLPPQEIRRRVDAALDAVGARAYAKAQPHLLSEGEKQLVAIAGVLAMDPKYVVLDEPTAYLDPASRQKVLEVMSSLHRRGITILHVTHHMEDLTRADRVVVMKAGTILADKIPSELLSMPDCLRDAGLGLPRVSELLWKLREYGLDVNPSTLDLEEACREIMASKSESRSRKIGI